MSDFGPAIGRLVLLYVVLFLLAGVGIGSLLAWLVA